MLSCSQVASKINKKSIKNQCKIQSLFKSIFWLIFHWFWRPRYLQNPSKIHDKSILTPMKKWSIFELIFYGVLVDLRAQDPSQDPLSWSPKPPSWSQDRAKSLQSWRQDRLKTSTWSQDGPKTLPRHLQGPILKDFGLHFGWFFNDFSRILMIIFVAFFIHFGIHFASILHTLLCLKLAPHTTVCLSSKIAKVGGRRWLAEGSSIDG